MPREFWIRNTVWIVSFPLFGPIFMLLARDRGNDFVEIMSFLILPIFYLALGMYLRRTNNLPPEIQILARAKSRFLLLRFEVCEALALFLLMLFESGMAVVIYASDEPPEVILVVIGLFLIPHYLFAMLVLRYEAIVKTLAEGETNLHVPQLHR